MNATSDDAGPRGRWAPTPSGELHVGNARTALAAWLSVRSRGGSFIWRLEDLDGPRTMPGVAEASLQELSWLGLDWDEGPDQGGPHEPYVQSQRHALYDEALERLVAQDRLFPCRLSRSDLKNLATAPHGAAYSGGGMPPYPREQRPANLPETWYADLRSAPRADAAIRFKVDDRAVRFRDAVYGEIEERVDRAVGDFVLLRRDGVYAYQLAVVVDDLAMGVTEVVRGHDLIDSTARQIQLFEALGGAERTPSFIHVPLILNSDGDKLSKRDEALTLRSLQEAGVRAENLVGYFAWSLGLVDSPTPRSARSLVDDFSWERIRRENWTLPLDLAREIE